MCRKRMIFALASFCVVLILVHIVLFAVDTPGLDTGAVFVTIGSAIPAANGLLTDAAAEIDSNDSLLRGNIPKEIGLPTSVNEKPRPPHWAPKARPDDPACKDYDKRDCPAYNECCGWCYDEPCPAFNACCGWSS